MTVQLTNEQREMMSKVMRLIRAIPSEKRAQASRENGKLGGRPRKGADATDAGISGKSQRG